MKNGGVEKRTQVSFSKLPSGIYILKVISDGMVMIRKIVKE